MGKTIISTQHPLVLPWHQLLTEAGGEHPSPNLSPLQCSGYNWIQCSCYFSVNLTQARILWKERASTEKVSVGKSVGALN